MEHAETSIVPSPQFGTWQPIQTAPKDGTKLIVCTKWNRFVPWVFWDGEDWTSEFMQWSGKPTHWMPFPDPPQEL